MSQISETDLNKLYDDFVSERNLVQLEMKNDKELAHTSSLSTKISVLTSLITQVIKYRNIKIKEKLKS